MSTKIVRATCIKKLRDNNNSIVAYTIMDLIKGDIKDISSIKLKEAIKNNRIYTK